MVDVSGETYISLSLLAPYVNYQFYNGGYQAYTEEKDKGYVKCDNEIATFEAGSTTVYKNNANNKLNFDAQTIDKPILLYGENLYAHIEDAKKIFNVGIYFRQSDTTLVVQTLPYIVSYYNTQLKQYGYDGVSEDFNTQKTIDYGMIVVKKEDSYGVISAKDFSVIISPRYSKLLFIEATKEFIATSDGKTGLVSSTGETKIPLRYDDIGLIDTNRNLYFAKNDNLMGVLNGNGKVIIYMEYNSLGIDREKFPYDNVKNNMLIFDNCIPTLKLETITTLDRNKKEVITYNEKWGLADRIGNVLLDNEYDNLGYVAGTDEQRSVNSVVIISKIKGIVVGKEGKYGVVNYTGKVIIPFEYDKIYSITNEGQDEFYLEQEGKTIKLDKYIKDNKIVVEEASETNNNTIDNSLTNGINTTLTNSVDSNTVGENTSTEENVVQPKVPTVVEEDGITTVIM